MKKLRHVGIIALAASVILASCATLDAFRLLGISGSSNAKGIPETPEEDVIVSTLAGEGKRGLRNGPGEAARFHYPAGIGVDPFGNVYVADTTNRAIREIEPNGEVSIRSRIPHFEPTSTAYVGGSMSVSLYFPDKGSAMYVFVNPVDVVVGVDGNLYLVAIQDNRIWRVIPGGKVELEYGQRGSVSVKKEDNGKGINIGGEIELLAGKHPFTKGDEDGRLTDAEFNSPLSLTTDIAGNLYVSDTGNNSIRKITVEGEVITLAGGKKGFKDGAGDEARFSDPIGIAVDANGNVYVADRGNHSIRKITPEGVVSTLAGNGEKGFMDGSTTEAQFNRPTGVAVDMDGTVYVADQKNNLIRKITPEGVVSTYAGSGIAGYGDGSAVTARFKNPFDVAVDLDGNVYVSDIGNQRIRMIEKVSRIRRDVVRANDSDRQSARM